MEVVKLHCYILQGVKLYIVKCLEMILCGDFFIFNVFIMEEEILFEKAARPLQKTKEEHWQYTYGNKQNLTHLMCNCATYSFPERKLKKG